MFWAKHLSFYIGVTIKNYHSPDLQEETEIVQRK